MCLLPVVELRSSSGNSAPSLCRSSLFEAVPQENVPNVWLIHFVQLLYYHKTCITTLKRKQKKIYRWPNIGFAKTCLILKGSGRQHYLFISLLFLTWNVFLCSSVCIACVSVERHDHQCPAVTSSHHWVRWLHPTISPSIFCLSQDESDAGFCFCCLFLNYISTEISKKKK